jgi:hypothetical protein
MLNNDVTVHPPSASRYNEFPSREVYAGHTAQTMYISYYFLISLKHFSLTITFNRSKL